MRCFDSCFCLLYFALVLHSIISYLSFPFILFVFALSRSEYRIVSIHFVLTVPYYHLFIPFFLRLYLLYWRVSFLFSLTPLSYFLSSTSIICELKVHLRTSIPSHPIPSLTLTLTLTRTPCSLSFGSRSAFCCPPVSRRVESEAQAPSSKLHAPRSKPQAPSLKPQAPIYTSSSASEVARSRILLLFPVASATPKRPSV